MTIPKIKLKNTDLEVSRFCFGTMTFGKPLDQAGTTQVVNRCIEAGINFFDTANMYQTGVAETMLGHAIKGRRDHLMIASKVFFKMGEDADQQGLSRKAILRAIDESLQRLGTDYLDLYYFHAPDHDVPIEESHGSDGVAGEAGQGALSRVIELRRLAGGADATGWRRSAAGMRPTFRNPCTTCWRAASSRNICRCARSSASRPSSTIRWPAVC